MRERALDVLVHERVRSCAIFHLFFALPSLVVIARWLVPLPIPAWIKVAGAPVLLFVSQYHLWSKFSSGSVFAPEFPRPIVLLFNWAFGAVLLLAVMQIAIDAVGLVGWAVQRSEWAMPDAVRYGAGVLALVLAAIGVANATRVPPIKDVSVAVRDLPPQFDGYRLLQLTDLHLSRLFTARWAREMVARANTAGADAIVVTGDFIDGSVAMRHDDVAPLAGLRAPDGVFAVPGNHEYFFDYTAWMRHIEGLGIRMLPNAHATLRRGEAALVIAGVTDASARGAGQTPPDLNAALANVPAGAPIVLLDHQPRNARAAAARGVALQMSGHTHGGMIVGLAKLLEPANAGFVSGAYQVGGMTLYVSNGTALWPGFALRLGRPSEMTRFTLRRAAG